MAGLDLLGQLLDLGQILLVAGRAVRHQKVLKSIDGDLDSAAFSALHTIMPAQLTLMA